MIKTISTDVVKRFMSEDQLNAFMAKYDSNKKSLGANMNREDRLSKPISDQEAEMLRFYLEDVTKSLTEYEKTHGMRVGTIGHKCSRIALKLLFQNPIALQRLLKLR